MYVCVYQYIVLKGKPAHCKVYICFHCHYLDEDKLLQDSYISQPVMLPDGILGTLGKKKQLWLKRYFELFPNVSEIYSYNLYLKFIHKTWIFLKVSIHFFVCVYKSVFVIITLTDCF